jgi:hypothetical protein
LVERAIAAVVLDLEGDEGAVDESDVERGHVDGPAGRAGGYLAC